MRGAVVATCLTGVDKMLRKVLRLNMVPHIGPGLVGKASAQSAEVTAPLFIFFNIFQEVLRLLRPCKYSFSTNLKRVVSTYSMIIEIKCQVMTSHGRETLHTMYICAFYLCAHFDCFLRRNTAHSNCIGSCLDNAMFQHDSSLCPFEEMTFHR